jgi:Dullard-like phosphatase family protein
MNTKSEPFFEDNLGNHPTLGSQEVNLTSNNAEAIIENKDTALSRLNIFIEQSSQINLNPIPCCENYHGNYENYIKSGLTDISKLKNIDLENALSAPNITENVPYIFSKKRSSENSKNKKILLLDLDETLIHADFNEEFAGDEAIKYETIIKFFPKVEQNEENEEYSVGIFVRNGVNDFLAEVSKHFDVGIFTASVKEYADAVISFLDPEKKYIKFRLYRNNCINFNNSITIKDLRIFKDCDLSKIVLLDNSIYSFAAQLSNGILINSFYNDKSDMELYNVLNYLMNQILNAEDVRDVNERIFDFEKIMEDISNSKNEVED